MWLEVLCLVTLLAFSFYRWVTVNNDFFAKRGIPYDKPLFLMGSFVEIFRRQKPMYDVIIDLYNKHDGKVYGIFDQRQPLLLIRDPELIKLMAIRDFEHFPNHRNAFLKDDAHESHIFGSSLFFLQNAKWKEMRNTLSPAFTGSKLRNTFLLMNEVGQQIGVYLDGEIAKKCDHMGGMDLNLKDLAKRFTSDVIATTAFGVQVNSFSEADNEFYTMGKKMTSFTFWQNIKFVLISNFGKLCKLLNIDLFDKKFTNYYMNLVMNTMAYRKQHNVVRPDMINMLMEAQGLLGKEKPNKGKYKWTDTDMVAQCLLFFIAGYETVSSLMCFTALELMFNPKIQEKLYEEISKVSQELGDQPLTYEVIQNMTYLDMIISEVLRKWPGTLAVDRVCSKEISYDLDNGQKLTINAGDAVWFPINALHMDAKYWPEPEKFMPERFSEENKEKIMPFTYMPFGVGPRNCIGSRLALLEAKSYIYYLVRDYRIESSPQMYNPTKLSPNLFEMVPEGGFWFRLVQRKFVVEKLPDIDYEY
ncbi:probable cytochrome P450 9f2 [Stomoxys calcitrans]|uniref:probable cytochrome P450 9f2 n=1 Tax=Stomoxys calcitrans TaxID=35570 RepID=UPI0027E2BF44|nr:probable cytochrome P450 9f2 [Stomoxys calcitrans]